MAQCAVLLARMVSHLVRDRLRHRTKAGLIRWLTRGVSCRIAGGNGDDEGGPLRRGAIPDPRADVSPRHALRVGRLEADRRPSPQMVRGYRALL